MMGEVRNDRVEVTYAGYRMAQNFGGTKLWRIAANKHFGGKNIGGLAALHSKVARIKVFGR